MPQARLINNGFVYLDTCVVFLEQSTPLIIMFTNPLPAFDPYPLKNEAWSNEASISQNDSAKTHWVPEMLSFFA